MKDQYEIELKKRINSEKAALELLEITSSLQLNKSVELVLFRRKLFDKRLSEIINDHVYVRNFSGIKITLELTLNLTRALNKLDLAPSKIDLGRLSKEWLEEGKNFADYDAFVAEKLKDFVGVARKVLKPRDVVLYGFGRIGRLAARVLIEHTGSGQQLRLRGIVTRERGADDLEKRASLLSKDSIHGKFAGAVEADMENESLIINGHSVKMISAASPSEVDYTQYGINDAIIIDNTGVWRDEKGLGEHLKAKGSDMVVLTAPGKGDIPNIVYGVNHQGFSAEKQKIFTAASCTTNAIVPVVKVIEDKFGIEQGHVETVHAYTNDQNLLDNYHKKSRRGRGAPVNMVITETGAGKAVTKVFPFLKGKLTSNSVRVPVADVSLAIVSLELKTKTTVEEVNALLRDASLYGELVEQIDFSVSEELVSSDVIGNSHACEIDSKATIVSEDGKRVVIYAWYDNEYGYTCQVVRLVKHLAGVRRLVYY
ncbi:MAG: glyceraldehyde-3-phosphate dehydrogenase [Chitinophagales bacterium]|nr:glyceraldehyde-3-phosphate dehydrogenase [Chitinophagales bacterium]MCO5280654.1 glyceraldehyde-3-phosphate dehydrogenase [Chitinophagales bacterium]OJV29275.1 MAG: glyceraldehyde-3-phosphate dehydrogenase [Bacteroidetes bacterium 37-13]HRN95468.1 glyceraldehyde-3-phosphate dehydrogenase [Chitinophagales bacterium]HRP39226.1 glyceraldehyde-3-phosphate dehydrogenase [Chitinophagales bacterium]